jgi:hypothetical protein
MMIALWIHVIVPQQPLAIPLRFLAVVMGIASWQRASLAHNQVFVRVLWFALEAQA